MATQQTPFVPQDPSATGLQGRTVNDEIRNLIPGNSPLLELVAVGVAQDGKVKKSAGMISKQATDTVRFEAFTHTPPGYLQTVATKTSALVYTFASVAEIYVRMVFENTANKTVGVVSAISSTSVTFTSIGSTAFSAVAGDVLMRLGNAYEANSSDPAYLQKDDDNIYNMCQTFRFPTAASNSQIATKQVAGGDFFQRASKYAMIEGMRDIERAFLFGKKSSSGNTTEISDISKNVATTEGLWNQSGVVFDAGGNMTPSKLFKDIPNKMDSSVGDMDRVIMLTSKKQRTNLLEQQQDSIRIDQKSDPKEYGVKIPMFMTGGPNIEIRSHDAFNNAGHEDEGLIFLPERLKYRYLKGRDIAPNKDIQSNSTDGKIDEIFGEVGLQNDDGGVSIMRLINMS